MLGGVGEGNRGAVERGEGVLAVVRRKHPEATGAASATDIGGERGNEVHVAVAREEAGMGGEAGLAGGAQPAFDGRESALDESLQVGPVGGVVGLGIGGEHDVPARAQAVGFGAEVFKEEVVEVAGVEIEAGGEFVAGTFELGGFDGEDEVAAFSDGIAEAVFDGGSLDNLGVVERGGLKCVTRELSRAGRIGDGERLGAAGLVSAFTVRGEGRLYVLPGLADMHVHLFDRDEMLLNLANGVTTVRNMHGTPRHLAWRDSIDRGEILGPRLFSAGPILDGDPPTRATNVVVRSVEEARAAVKQQLDDGFDFIKIYDNVSPAVYAAINAEARARGRKVVGHLPTPVGLDRATTGLGQHGVEHAEELLPFFNDGRVSDTSTTGVSDSVTRVARRFANAGVWLDPTVGVYDSALRQSRSWAVESTRPEMAYVNPSTRRDWGWDDVGRSRAGAAGELARYERTRAFMVRQLIPAFRKAGVRLLAGSDAPIPSLIPGFALLDELDLLAEARLTPFEVLQAATTTAAEFLGVERRLGALAVGRAADLLVVEGNPLLNLAALRKRQGVVVGGRWLNQPGLRHRLDSLATRYRGKQ